MKITHAQFMSHIKAVPHRLNLGAWNLEVELAKEAEKEFKDAIDSGGFDGTPWPPRTSKRKRSGTVLKETGTMRNAIKTKSAPNAPTRIFVDANALTGAKRNKRGFYYPAVHQYGRSGGFRYYGKSKVPVIRREFMGYTAKQELLLNQGSKKMFDDIFGKL